MPTNWNLIREVINGTVDACEAVERLEPDLFKGEYEARSDFQADVNVGDFLNRFIPALHDPVHHKKQNRAQEISKQGKGRHTLYYPAFMLFHRRGGLLGKILNFIPEVDQHQPEALLSLDQKGFFQIK